MNKLRRGSRRGKRVAIDVARNFIRHKLRNAISRKLDSEAVSHPPHSSPSYVVFRHMYNKVGPSRDTCVKEPPRKDRQDCDTIHLFFFSPRSTRARAIAPPRERDFNEKKHVIYSPFVSFASEFLLAHHIHSFLFR